MPDKSEFEKRLGNIASVCGLVFGFFYIFGMLVVNMYLSRYDIFDISPFQARYIITGMVFFYCFMTPCFIIRLAEGLVTSLKQKNKTHILTNLITLGAAVWMIGSLWIYLHDGLVETIGDVYRPYLRNIYYLVFYLTIYFGLIKKVLFFPQNQSLKIRVIRSVSIFIFMFIWSFFYVDYIHPGIQLAYGGGKKRCVDIALSEEGKKALEVINIPVNKRGVSRIYLIHENAQDYFFIWDNCDENNDKSIRVPKSLVKAIKHVEKHSDSKQYDDENECEKSISKIGSPTYDENGLNSLLKGEDKEAVCMFFGKPIVEKPCKDCKDTLEYWIYCFQQGTVFVHFKDEKVFSVRVITEKNRSKKL